MGSGFPPAPALCEEGVELGTERKWRDYSGNHFKYPSRWLVQRGGEKGTAKWQPGRQGFETDCVDPESGERHAYACSCGFRASRSIHCSSKGRCCRPVKTTNIASSRSFGKPHPHSGLAQLLGIRHSYWSYCLHLFPFFFAKRNELVLDIIYTCNYST